MASLTEATPAAAAPKNVRRAPPYGNGSLAMLLPAVWRKGAREIAIDAPPFLPSPSLCISCSFFSHFCLVNSSANSAPGSSDFAGFCGFRSSLGVDDPLGVPVVRPRPVNKGFPALGGNIHRRPILPGRVHEYRAGAGQRVHGRPDDGEVWRCFY